MPSSRPATQLAALARTLRPRVVYADLDGTLLGPGGSLFAAPGGGVTLVAARAVEALARAGIELVPLSGRTEPQVREVARVLGATSFIAELGGVAVRGDEVERHTGDAPQGLPPARAMARAGVPGLLLERFRGRLEPHAPWAFAPRECTILLRGVVDLDEAQAALDAAGHTWVRIHDNGVLRRTFPTLPSGEIHVYHLAPRGVGKAEAVAIDARRRGLGPAELVAIGDSPTDVELASHVGAVLVVANGAGAVPPDHPPNVVALEGSYGEGFAEAVAAFVAPPSGAA